jgi:uncharacterized repeat protein (TIGR03803 family)
LTTLFSFTGDDGNPQGRLVQGTNGSFYGTTVGWYNDGTVFRITTNGVLTNLVSFNGANGSAPFAGLIQASDGSFYGTTCVGGSQGLGTVFKMTPEGVFTTLISFTNAGRLYGGLVQGSDGNLYGTTAGISNSPSSIYPGIVFKLTLEGSLTTLATPFNYNSWPGTLIQASDGNLYGTTSSGGGNGLGTLFQVTSEGAFTTLLSFACTDTGATPSDLMQATNGLLYGATRSCGKYHFGTLFQITIAPPPTLRNASMSDNRFTFNWDAVSGRVYRVEYSTNLASTNWYSLSAYVPATNSTMEISSPAFDSQRLFRLVLLP